MREGEVIQQVQLHYVGEPSTYAAELPLAAAGSFRVEILAMEPLHANFGRAQGSVTVVP